MKDEEDERPFVPPFSSTVLTYLSYCINFIPAISFS
jgi:hypothetical protein